MIAILKGVTLEVFIKKSKSYAVRSFSCKLGFLYYYSKVEMIKFVRGKSGPNKYFTSEIIICNTFLL
jgi:hypothetical protein